MGEHMTMEAGGTARANMVVGSAAGSGRVPCTGWGWVGGSTVGLRQLASVVVSACDPRLVKSAGPFPCSGAKAAGVMAEQGLGARIAPLRGCLCSSSVSAHSPYASALRVWVGRKQSGPSALCPEGREAGRSHSLTHQASGCGCREVVLLLPCAAAWEGFVPWG